MLQYKDCSNVQELVDSEKITIDHHCREGSSDAAKLAARQVVSKYWVSYGYEDTRVQACAGLAKVCHTFWLLLVFFLLRRLIFASFSMFTRLWRNEAKFPMTILWPGWVTK